MLVAAVSMVYARSHAAAISAELVLGATARAGLLTDNNAPQPTVRIDYECCQRGLEQCPAIGSGCESPGEEIEPVLLHRHP